MLRILKKIIKYFFLILSLVLFFLTLYIEHTFKNVKIEQLLFSLFTSEGTNLDTILYGTIFVICGVLFSIVLLIIIKKLILKINIKAIFTLKCKNKKLVIDIFSISRKKETIFLIVVLLSSFMFTIKNLEIDSYVKNQLSSTKVFDNYYVYAKNIDIEFPKEKQNLIYIFVESLENTGISISNGGTLIKAYTSNLENIALNNINFSNTSNIGGALQISGASFTAGAMVAQTAGIPLKIPVDGNEYINYGSSFPGVYNLGDILLENGYHNYIMMGSNASFGGRRDYFKYHGKYTIYDYIYAKENNWIEKDYRVWWGYEDSKLYEFAKQELLKISQKEEPFNFTMLTADTHFIDGYLDESCSSEFDSKYANSFSCTDIMLSKFISWIEKQAFYKNTTIIITGDHLTMQQGFYNVDDSYNRTIYNAFINSKESTTNLKNRVFSSLDMFPTTLAALGVSIEGERIGLGTNLFSNTKTLEEELGFDTFDNELLKKSFYYDNNILGDTYYKMLEESKSN